MRTLRIIEHISLDGVIQAPGGPDEDGDYPHGGWAVPHYDPAVGEAIDEAQSERFDLLLGRRTYDIFAGYWPKQSGPMADSLNAATKYVATHRPDSLGWGPVEDLGAGHHRGRPPHQGAERAGPDRLGQLYADACAAGARPGRRGAAARLPDPPGRRKALLLGRRPAARARARRHQGRALGRRHQHLLVRWRSTHRKLRRCGGVNRNGALQHQGSK